MSATSPFVPAEPSARRIHDKINSDLVTTGWSVVDDYLPSGKLRRLWEELRSMKQTGVFRASGIAGGCVRPDMRGDLIHWIDPADPQPAFAELFRELEVLRSTLNQAAYLGLFDLEMHAAIYKKGSFYERHLDNFSKGGRRILTVILYLNEDWRPSDGGQLRLYQGDSFVDIQPEAGRLVSFFSNTFYHEVLPTQRERYSLTGWFRGRQ